MAAWETVASDVKLGLDKGQGFELSRSRDRTLPSLVHRKRFGDSISFSYPFLNAIGIIRGIDPIKVYAEGYAKPFSKSILNWMVEFAIQRI